MLYLDDSVLMVTGGYNSGYISSVLTWDLLGDISDWLQLPEFPVPFYDKGGAVMSEEINICEVDSCYK